MSKLNQETNKIKYFLYARKSSEAEDRQVASIEAQINELKRLATQLGIEILEEFTEAKSAKKPYIRPVFATMLERIEKGEALHEIYGGNRIFATNVVNKYGKIPTPTDFYLDWFSSFHKKHPDMVQKLKRYIPIFGEFY
ncbi:MAG: recombinase, partial [Parcubacteria group bacterium Gr01-1014_29]